MRLGLLVRGVLGRGERAGGGESVLAFAGKGNRDQWVVGSYFCFRIHKTNAIAFLLRFQIV